MEGTLLILGGIMVMEGTLLILEGSLHRSSRCGGRGRVRAPRTPAAAGTLLLSRRAVLLMQNLHYTPATMPLGGSAPPQVVAPSATMLLGGCMTPRVAGLRRRHGPVG